MKLLFIANLKNTEIVNYDYTNVTAMVRFSTHKRSKLLTLHAESDQSTDLDPFLDNVATMLAKMGEFEITDDNTGNEYRRESVCIVREYRSSRKNQSTFLDTIKHERSAEDYQKVQSMKFNVTVRLINFMHW